MLKFGQLTYRRPLQANRKPSTYKYTSAKSEEKNTKTENRSFRGMESERNEQIKFIKIRLTCN